MQQVWRSAHPEVSGAAADMPVRPECAQSLHASSSPKLCLRWHPHNHVTYACARGSPERLGLIATSSACLPACLALHTCPMTQESLGLPSSPLALCLPNGCLPCTLSPRLWPAVIQNEFTRINLTTEDGGTVSGTSVYDGTYAGSPLGTVSAGWAGSM